ncbi:MAG: CpXC domain-containing protein [Erysipelotrichaceae bacterium]|nr:CpXC domain-containing protein [Erysipelotrichaceae bacterium]MDY5251777.1 CpXC domain-containing protein [Erysipelotrichaceae bacterium]
MSKSKRVFKCPHCGKELTLEFYDSVNVQNDEDLKAQVIAGDIFRFECDKCHYRFMACYDCLYHDPQNKFMVYLKSSPVPANEQLMTLLNKGYTLRWCKDIGSFIEKIEVLSEGLDDRAVEFAKYDSFIDYIQNKGKQEDVTGVYYQGFVDDILRIKLELDDKALTTMTPYYGLVAEMADYEEMFKIEDPFFACIDPKWIIDIFEGAQAA